ncbi:MAG: dUTP diphosphatase [Chlamydiales bacterium]
MSQHHEKVEVLIHREEGVSFPHYASVGASGADVYAHLENPVFLEPGKRALISTGIRFEIPDGYEIQVRPRSGLAVKHGITVLNTPGTIDADYRGELKIVVINLGEEIFEITPRMRIAQLVLSPVVIADYMDKEEPLTSTVRNTGGFGHSGFH